MCMQVAAAVPVECDAQFVWWTEEEEHRIDGVVRWVIGQDGGFLTAVNLSKSRVIAWLVFVSENSIRFYGCSVDMAPELTWPRPFFKKQTNGFTYLFCGRDFQR